MRGLLGGEYLRGLWCVSTLLKPLAFAALEISVDFGRSLEENLFVVTDRTGRFDSDPVESKRDP